MMVHILSIYPSVGSGVTLVRMRLVGQRVAQDDGAELRTLGLPSKSVWSCHPGEVVP